MISAASLRQAREVLRQVQPRAIVLDIVLRGEDAWNWLAELKTDAATRAIPILVVTAVEDAGKGYALGADEYCVKPLERKALLETLERLTGAEARSDEQRGGTEKAGRRRVLIVDDHGPSRYILVRLIQDLPYTIHEASNGTDGLRMAKEMLPDLIFLDLDMPDISGFEVLDQLKSDAGTRAIPVIIVTSLTLSELERERLQGQACNVLSKSELSREQIEHLLATVLPEPAALGTTDERLSPVNSIRDRSLQ
jgi:CheY-like chemotaxis protein